MCRPYVGQQPIYHKECGAQTFCVCMCVCLLPVSVAQFDHSSEEGPMESYALSEGACHCRLSVDEVLLKLSLPADCSSCVVCPVYPILHRLRPRQLQFSCAVP